MVSLCRYCRGGLCQQWGISRMDDAAKSNAGKANSNVTSDTSSICCIGCMSKCGCVAWLTSASFSRCTVMQWFSDVSPQSLSSIGILPTVTFPVWAHCITTKPVAVHVIMTDSNKNSSMCITFLIVGAKLQYKNLYLIELNIL